MQSLDSSQKNTATYIHTPSTSHKETVKVFIEMIDFLQSIYTTEEFNILLEHVLFITQQEIDNLQFTSDQFKQIMDFYLKDHDTLNIEEEIVGHYDGYGYDPSSHS